MNISELLYHTFRYTHGIDCEDFKSSLGSLSGGLLYRSNCLVEKQFAYGQVDYCQTLDCQRVTVPHSVTFFYYKGQ